MFGLTKQERQAILFLAGLGLMGIGINGLLRTYVLGDVKTYLEDIAKIDLNQADKNSLMAVPGIKEKLAERIISYRQEKGIFNDIEELKQIKGITGFRYEKIKDSFCVR